MSPWLERSVTPPVLVLVGGVLACGIAGVLTPLVRMAALRYGWVAHPERQRWGRRVTARLGGVAIYVGCVATTLMTVSWSRQLMVLLVGYTSVLGIGLADDFRRMQPYTKLLLQLVVSSVLVAAGIRIELIAWAWLAVPLSIFWLVLLMNAFNLLDNMDGLAAGVGAIAAGFCALHASLTGQWTIAAMAAVIAGACLGFLLHNFPPAKIYMGDSGSHLLGLSLASLALLGTWRHSTQLLSVLAIPVLLLAVPIFDTCFVTIQRLLHRQHPFVGGTDHVSHRLAVLGLTVRQTVLALYAVSACLGVVSVASVGLQSFAALALWLAVITGLLLFGSYLTKANVYRLEAAAQPEEIEGAEQPLTLIKTMLVHKRRLVEVLVDFALISIAYMCAHLLRFEGTLDLGLQQLVIQSLPVILVVKLACFAWCGVYRGVWRYLGVWELAVLFKATALGSVLSSLALLYLWRFEGYSRAVLVIDWMLVFLAVGGSRIVERLLDVWIKGRETEGAPALIIGAGDAGVRVMESLRAGGSSGHAVIGFLDDDLRKSGSSIHGCPVLGTREALAELADCHQIRAVLVAITDPPGQLLQHVQRCCEPRGIPWKVVTSGVTETR